MKKTRIGAVICLLVLLVSMIPMAALAQTAWVKTKNGASLNVRSSMFTHANNRVATLSFGTKVNIISSTGDWSRISFHNPATNKAARGYVLTKYLTTKRSGLDGVKTEGMTSIAHKKATVKPSHDNGWVFMRTGTSTSSRIITHYRKGETLVVRAVGKNWAKVYDPRTKKVGYMMKKFLRY